MLETGGEVQYRRNSDAGSIFQPELRNGAMLRSLAPRDEQHSAWRKNFRRVPDISGDDMCAASQDSGGSCPTRKFQK